MQLQNGMSGAEMQKNVDNGILDVRVISVSGQ
jgi:hypothetical protein